ncbi:MAG: hypothetical protein L3K01_06360 [Thermoplasmata archaeon]|nr:hypothetical protein [Thermoplasmata archaeon]
MTTIRTLAAHEVVRAAYPREVTERDEIGMAVGKAIDGTLSKYSYEFARGWKPTRTAMNHAAAEILDEELRDAHIVLPAVERDRHLAAASGVLQEFRRSELTGLARPRSRLILINEQVGVYAQPDFWNGRDRIYEMKSYHANPIPPEIRLQVQLFQCAFPGFRAFLAWFDRHATPISTTLEEVPAPDQATAEGVLGLAYRTGMEKGIDKVLEYMDSRPISYSVPIPSGPAEPGETPRTPRAESDGSEG